MAVTKLLLPSFSPTMNQGKIIKWNVKEGQQVKEGDSIALIETDKASVDFEMSDKLIIAKIIKDENSGLIDVGDVIGYGVSSIQELQSFKIPQDSENVQKQIKIEEIKTEEQKPQEIKKQKPQQNKKIYSKYELLKMPSLSPTMTQGKIIEWYVKEGDKVSEGGQLAKLETDKATLDFEVQEGGFIAKILRKAGDEQIPVGVGLIVLVKKKENIEEFKDFVDEEVEVETSQQTQDQTVTQKQQQTSDQQKLSDKEDITITLEKGQRIFISPLAKNLAQQNNLTEQQLFQIKGSGPNNRIIKQDIENYKPTPTLEKPKEVHKETIKFQDTQKYKEIPVSGMRNIIAQRLSQSKREIPHYYLETNIVMNNLMQFRKKLNEDLNLKISINDFIIKAVAKACLEVPEANSQWSEKTIKRFENVDVGFAVDLGDGLITPIVKNVNNKSISQVNKETKELVEKARNNKLMPNEYQGGTITISNLGTMGIISFTAVINPPQACILAIGSTNKTPVLDEKTNGIKWEDQMMVCLSGDHRVIDGAVGARWLVSFKKQMENPLLMLI